MNANQYKKIAVLLKKAYAEMEQEALDSGLSIASPEFEDAVAKVREQILAKMGFTLEQYREIKDKVTAYTSADLMGEFENLKKDVTQKVDTIINTHIPSEDEIKEIASDVAKTYIKAPEIINKIVKQIKVERPPQVIENTIREEYDPAPIMAEIGYLNEKVDKIKVPEPYNDAPLREDLDKKFKQELKESINTLGMPDFRKLAMGLRADIDRIDNEPAGSGTGDVLLDQTTPQTFLNGTPYFNTLTATQIVATDANKGLQTLAVATYPSLTELSYVKGVTSAIQGQINAKAPTANPNFTGQVEIGETTGFTGEAQIPLAVGADVDNWAGIYVQNVNDGTAAAADIVIGADNDGTAVTGHFIDMGIENSLYDPDTEGIVKTVTIHTAGTGYVEDEVITLTATGDGNFTARVDEIDGSGGVVTFTITDNGTGYSVANNLATTASASGTGCKLNVTALFDNSLYGANDGYVLVSGGNLMLGTDDEVAGKQIKFHTGGLADANLRATVTDSGWTGMRKQPRVYSATTLTALTPEISTYDIFHLTAQNRALTINNPSTSTPADGELMEIRLLDNGTARALTWGNKYVAKAGTALPTTTTLSKNLVMLFEYNTNLTQWNLLASGLQA